jgi:uncharacterized protein YjhX (UPF0386 family)
MQDLDWQEVGLDSDNIERMAHSGNDLYVEFKGNTGYKYLNVPFEIFQRILNKECISKSKGRPSYGSTLDKLVKKAGYQHQQYK